MEAWQVVLFLSILFVGVVLTLYLIFTIKFFVTKRKTKKLSKQQLAERVSQNNKNYFAEKQNQNNKHQGEKTFAKSSHAKVTSDKNCGNNKK